MVAHARGCDEGRLRRHLEGTLAGDEQEALASHLCDCEACRAALDDLATDGLRWGNFREFLGGDGEAPSGQGPHRPSGDDAERLATILGLLEPPEDPGHLGQLGPLDVLEVVGQGGMGVVLKAHDRGLGRTVAIKVLAPELAFLSSARKRFAREARAAASVAHEHVVAIHAVDSWKGIPYLVMQYVPGISLQQRIDRKGPLAVIEVLRIGMQVASGLAAAHAQGLVHRDIKPANILLENGVERVRITDFGLARAAADASLTQSGLAWGTPQYMAPEQTRCEAVDPRADLFSLGSLMYAMCTGHSPFRAETTMAVLRRVCEDDPRPIRQVNPEVPAWLAAIVAKLLAKRPDDRFQSAAELAALLGRCVAYLELPGEGPPPFRADRGRAGRWRWIGIGALAVLVLAAIPAAFHIRESRRADRIRGADASRVLPTTAPVARPPVRAWEVRVTPDPTTGVVAIAAGPLGRPRPSDEEIASLLGPAPLDAGSRVPPWPLGFVTAAAYTADGRLLALGSGDGSVTLYETTTRRIRSILDGDRGQVWSMMFSPDGRLLATASGDWGPRPRNGRVRIWDVATETVRDAPAEDFSTPFAVAFSPDGRTIAWAGRSTTVTLWDAASRSVRAVGRGHRWTVRSIAFHPFEPVLVSAGFDGSIRFWDLRTGESSGEPIHHEGRSSNRVAISPDGRLLAANSGPRADEPGLDRRVPGWVTIWDWKTRMEVRRIEGFRFDILGLAYSPDGRTLATAGGYFADGAELALWDAATGRRLRDLEGHALAVEGATFSPDGRTLVGFGGEVSPNRGEVRIWDLTGLRPAAAR